MFVKETPIKGIRDYSFIHKIFTNVFRCYCRRGETKHNDMNGFFSKLDYLSFYNMENHKNEETRFKLKSDQALWFNLVVRKYTTRNYDFAITSNRGLCLEALEVKFYPNEINSLSSQLKMEYFSMWISQQMMWWIG